MSKHGAVALDHHVGTELALVITPAPSSRQGSRSIITPELALDHRAGVGLALDQNGVGLALDHNGAELALIDDQDDHPESEHRVLFTAHKARG